MASRDELLKALKELNPAQFEEVLFRLKIHHAIIPSSSVEQSIRAINVIKWLEQKQDGLTQLENILENLLKEASSSIPSSTVSSSNSSRSPEPSSKASRGPLPLLGVGIGFLLLIVIGFKILPQDSPPSHQSTPSTSNNNSSTAPQPSPTLGNTDYSSLKQALESEDLEKADKITTEILLKEAVKETDSKRLEDLLKLAKSNPKDINLSEEEIKHISCPVLRQLNQLWEDNSKGLFGFRKQNDIWNSIDHNNSKDWDEFASRVGWKINDKWASRENNFFIKKEGHLPSFIYVSSQKDKTGDKQPPIDWKLFFEHIQNCKL
jgi:hypothetical protein